MVRADSRNPLAYSNRALAHQAAGDADKAIADWTKAVELDPKMAVAWFGRALADRAKERTPASPGRLPGSSALRSAHCPDLQAIRGRNVNAEIQSLLGRLAVSPGPTPLPGAESKYKENRRQATDRSRQAASRTQPPIGVGPQRPGAGQSLPVAPAGPPPLAANLQGRRSPIRARKPAVRSASARPCHCRVQRSHPLGADFCQHYYNRGLAYHEKRQPDKAIDDYSQSIRLDPRHAAAHCNRANAHKLLGQSGPGHQGLRRGHPARPPLRAGLQQPAPAPIGCSGEFDRAIADAPEAIRLDPKFALAYYNRAWPIATRETSTAPSPITTR